MRERGEGGGGEPYRDMSTGSKLRWLIDRNALYL